MWKCFLVVSAVFDAHPSSIYLYIYIFFFLQNMTSCSAFYEKEAMLMDPVDGPILASLLGIHWRLKTSTTFEKIPCSCTFLQ